MSRVLPQLYQHRTFLNDWEHLARLSPSMMSVPWMVLGGHVSLHVTVEAKNSQLTRCTYSRERSFESGRSNQLFEDGTGVRIPVDRRHQCFI